jgi:hypothetical protein
VGVFTIKNLSNTKSSRIQGEGRQRRNNNEDTRKGKASGGERPASLAIALPHRTVEVNGNKKELQRKKETITIAFKKLESWMKQVI